MAESMVSASEVNDISAYLMEMGKRSNALKDSGDRIDSDIMQLSLELGKKRLRYSSMMGELKADVNDLEQQIRSFQKSIMLIIGEMKNTLKKEDLQRFERRVDLWSPESKVSRQEAERVLINKP